MSHASDGPDKLIADLSVTLWWRESTQEWICEIDVKNHEKDSTENHRFTGKTREAARNAGFAAIGYTLLSRYWE